MYKEEYNIHIYIMFVYISSIIMCNMYNSLVIPTPGRRAHMDCPKAILRQFFMLPHTNK